MTKLKLYVVATLAMLASLTIFAQGGSSCATAQAATAGTNNVVWVGASPATGVDNEFKWFSYTAPGCGSVTVASCNGGSDTRLFVTSGSCAAQTVVGSAEDDCADGPTTAYASTLTFAVASGTTYFIKWGNGWDNVDFPWTLTYTPSTSNDVAVSGYANAYTVIPARQFNGALNLTSSIRNLQGVSHTGVTATAEVSQLVGTSFTVLTTLNSTIGNLACGTSTNATFAAYNTPNLLENIYRVIYSYSSNQSGADTGASNNRDTSFVAITQDLYARSDYFITGAIDGGLGVNGSAATPTLVTQGNVYEFPNADRIDSVFVRRTGGAVGDTIRAEVFLMNGNTVGAKVAQSANYVIPATGGGNRILALTSPLAVAAGSSYLVAIYHRATGTNVGIGYTFLNHTPGKSFIKINANAWSNPETVGFPVAYVISPIFPACPLNVSTPVVTRPTCFGSTNGAINNVTVSGGIAPYSYVWSNGVTTTNNTGLAAGTYTATITDAAGCTVSSAVTVTQPAAIQLGGFPTVSQITCNGANNGSITNLVIVGGTTPYTYAWSNGATTLDVTGLAPGLISGSVTDANGCTYSANLLITEPDALSLANAPDVFNATCFGRTDGFITNVQVVGGTTPYTYAWSNGATTADITGLGAGIYTGTVTDDNGCVFIAGPITITQPTAIQLGGFPTVSQITCNGANNGSITNLVIVGGTTPYTYAWSNGATTLDVTGLAPGLISGSVTDANGCTYSANLLITQPDALALANAPDVANATCFGRTDGFITNVVVVGGTAPYAYAWSNGATTADITGLAPNTYTGTITDDNGCVFIAGPITITQPAAIQLGGFPTVSQITCNGANNGSITNLVIVGGTRPYTYAWSNGATTLDVTGLAPGVISGSVTDANGCTYSANLLITQPDALSATATSNTTGATLTYTGGTDPVTYLWSNGSTDASITGTPGNYGYTLTDANGCVTSGSVDIMVGINSIENLASLEMFPNPTNGVAYVNVKLNNSDYVRAEVIDVQGRVISTQDAGLVNEQRIELNLQNAAAGLYFVRVTVGAQSTFLKLNVQR